MVNIQFDGEDELVELRQTVWRRSLRASETLLKRWGIVATDEQAAVVLIILLCVIFILSVYILVHYVYAGLPSDPALLESQSVLRTVPASR